MDSSSAADESEELTTLSEIGSQAPLLGGSTEWLSDGPIMYDHSVRESAARVPSRVPSIETVQSVIELQNGCNVILQGRIGQVGLLHFFVCFANFLCVIRDFMGKCIEGH